ncbi:MAG TPA: tetratricopeptide repeat protein [Thermoanaerobaculia bacterium]|jgi:tetratricopeptide (TPR) repeat protein|nr:tetratricopeptide repeat protein [Thermoanaerobaculia bacterium]
MSDRRKHLEFLRKTAKDAIWAGDYERALTLYDDGLGLARGWKDRDLEDLFTCNRATTLLEMDRQDFDLSRLKEILLRNPTNFNGALAAHTCARAHELRGEPARARFYAQTALQKSRDLGFDDILASSYNVLGNLELRESRFEEARDLFEEALGHLQARGDETSCLAAQYADNLGYCHIALDHVETGLPLVRRAVDLFEHHGARQALDYPCLDICFASVKTKQLEEAEVWGVQALALGKEFARNDVVKNSHYLLAETYSEMGKEPEADEHYEALADFYPNFPALKNYLRQISLMDVINLRA